MRKWFVDIGLVSVVALLLATTAGVAAQDGTSTIGVSVRVKEDPGLLLVSGTHTSWQADWNIYRSAGGVAFGDLQVNVTDARTGTQGWYVNATMSAFTLEGSPQVTADLRFTVLLIKSQVPANGAFNPVIATRLIDTTTILRSDVTASAQVTWETSLAVPPGLEPGVYAAVMTLDVYSGAPPP